MVGIVVLDMTYRPLYLVLVIYFCSLDSVTPTFCHYAYIVKNLWLDYNMSNGTLFDKLHDLKVGLLWIMSACIINFTHQVTNDLRCYHMILTTKNISCQTYMYKKKALLKIFSPSGCGAFALVHKTGYSARCIQGIGIPSHCQPPDDSSR